MDTTTTPETPAATPLEGSIVSQIATPEAAPAPSAKSWGDVFDASNGALKEGWENLVDEKHRGLVKDTRDLPTLVKRLHDTTTSLRGKQEGLVKVPGEGATPEEIAAFHKGLGVPEKPEDYDFTPPEGADWNTDLIDQFKPVFHKLGVPPKAARELAAMHEQLVGEQVKAGQASAKEWLSSQTNEVIQHFGGKPQALETVRAILADGEKYGLTPTNTDFLPANVWKYAGDLVKERNDLRAQVEALRDPTKPTGQKAGAGNVSALSVEQLKMEGAQGLADPRYMSDPTFRAAIDAKFAEASRRMAR
jgi:hypothetical protein